MAMLHEEEEVITIMSLLLKINLFYWMHVSFRLLVVVVCHVAATFAVVC